MAWGWKGCVPWPCGVRTGWTHVSIQKGVTTCYFYSNVELVASSSTCSTYLRVFGPNYDTTHQTQRGRWSRHNPRNKAAPGAQSVPCSIPVGSTHPDLRRHGAHGYRSDAKIFQMTHRVFIIFPGPSTWLQGSREKELLGFEIMVYTCSFHHALGSSP